MMMPPSIVLIESQQPDNTAIGSGFIVHHADAATYVVTCAHVVRDVGGPEQIKVAALAATVVAIGEDNGLDLAVLRVARLANRAALSLRTTSAPGQSVQIEGHYKYIAYRPLEAIAGRLARSFLLSDSRHEHYAPAWYISIDDQSKLLAGYSGSPVRDDATGEVLGVVITHDGDQQGRAISIEALRHIWPELPPKLLGIAPDAQEDTMQASIKPQPAQPETLPGVSVYLAAHPLLRGLAGSLPGEHTIDWARDFLDTDPSPALWERQLIPDLERLQGVFRSENKWLIRLRARARNSAGLVFGHVFNQRAGFHIHYTDKDGDMWRTDAPNITRSPLMRIDTSQNLSTRALVLEVAVTQGPSSVTEPVDHWLQNAAGALPAGKQSDAAIRQQLTAYFSDSELRDLCFDLHINYEDLPGLARSDKARELISYVARHNQSAVLLDYCRKLRPHVKWDADALPGLVSPMQAGIRKRILLAFEHETRNITPAEGAAIARQICGLVSAEGRHDSTVHLFGALPMGIALLVGWGLKAERTIQSYELNSQKYQPTCLLKT